MTLFLIGVAVLFIGCRVLQVKLDRYSRSLQDDALKAALMEQRKGWGGDDPHNPPPRGFVSWDHYEWHKASEGPR